MENLENNDGVRPYLQAGFTAVIGATVSAVVGALLIHYRHGFGLLHRAHVAMGDEAPQKHHTHRQPPIHPARAAIYDPVSALDAAANITVDATFSWPSFFLHVAWFVLWFALHLGVDLLTNLVSLEAIFLCVAIGIIQKRDAARDRRRDDTEAREVSELHDMNQTQLTILDRIATQAQLIQTLSDTLTALSARLDARDAASVPPAPKRAQKRANGIKTSD